MGNWTDDHWESRLSGGVPADARRSGSFAWFTPDRLVGQPIVTTPAVDQLLASAERSVQRLNSGPGGKDLTGLSRFLLRSEAIASSRIEGIAPAARHVALAELAADEEVGALSSQAELVARNMTLVRGATNALATADTVTLDAIVELHRALLADEPRHQGLRTVQNWIGGSDHHPLDADFVPPAPALVPDLMPDLAQYLNGASHSALVQAALVHAQFEAIHPFTDGNGRVGRALIHTVLTRRGLTPSAILPISLVLATFREDYVRGLTAFRHTSPAGSAEAIAATNIWLEEFAKAVERAATQADALRQQVAELRADWLERLEHHRNSSGRQRGLRSDSATHQILGDLPSTPVLTTTTVKRIHHVSPAAASKALNELKAAGILTDRSAGTRIRTFSADEVLDLITATERRLASTRFDTRTSPPNRPVPVHPKPRQDTR